MSHLENLLQDAVQHDTLTATVRELLVHAYDKGFAAADANDCCGCNLYNNAPPNPYKEKA